METKMTAEEIQDELLNISKQCDFNFNYNEVNKIDKTDSDGILYLTNYEGAKRYKELNAKVVYTLHNSKVKFSEINHYTITIRDDDTFECGRLMLEIINKHVDMIHKYLKNGTTVIVHCLGGVSRSPTLVAAYLIKYDHLTTFGSLKYLKGIRKCIFPNLSFINVLLEYEKNLAEEGQTGK